METSMNTITRRTAAVVVLLLALAAPIVNQSVAAQTVQYQEVSGTLPDLTPYLMRVPVNFNGTVINDLDYQSGANGASKMQLLQSGYALSGTGRPPWRAAHYDPAIESANLMTVLDIFQANFGKPRRILQYGCSGGGATALSIAEFYPNRIDGVIATNAYTVIEAANNWLDMLFTLRALLAPGSGFPVTAPTDVGAAIAAYQAVLDAAQQTPEGRARIALAIALAQYPSFTQAPPPTIPSKDVVAVQQAMYQTARYAVGFILTNRSLFELTAGGNPSWNTGVDYRQFYNNADPQQQYVVQALYQTAGLDLGQDLNQINQSPRIAGDPGAVAFWRVWPRIHNGNPGVPVLRWHTLGDPNLLPDSMQGYQTRVQAQGKADLYRQAFVNVKGHCTEDVAQIAAVVETMMRRLDTGDWGDSTTPAALNELAHTFSDPQYPYAFVYHALFPFNRPFYPDSVYPGSP